MRYKAYKKVDLPWVEEIPEHWEVKKIKRIFYIFKDISFIENPVVLSLTRKAVKVRDISTNEGQLASDYSNYNKVEPGDLLLNPMDLQSGANCNLSYISGVISPAYINLRKRSENINSKYYDYFFKHLYIIKAMEAIGRGVSKQHRWTLSNEVLLNYHLPVPPKEEQEQIAKFLDWKINEIDSLITEKKEKLKLLKNLRQLSIDQEFTHIKSYKWTRVKYLGEFLPTGSLSRNDMDDDSNYKAILYGDIYTSYDYLFSDSVTTINEKAYKEAPKVSKDTLFFTTSGELREEIGKCVLYTGDDNIAVGGDMVVLKPIENINPVYMMFALNTSDAIHYRYVFGRGDIIIHISKAKLADYSIKLPDIETQNYIAEKISNSIIANDKVQDNLKEEIKWLKKLKQSLISEVVTGKADIRNIEIPEYEKVQTIDNTLEEDNDFEEEEEEWA